MTNNIQQSAECHEHHMMLNEKIDKVDGILFGSVSKPNEIPLVTKVNIMFNLMIFLLVGVSGAFFTLINLSVKAGMQLNEIKNMSVALNNHLDQAKEFEKRLTEIELLVYKPKNLK